MVSEKGPIGENPDMVRASWLGAIGNVLRPVARAIKNLLPGGEKQPHREVDPHNLPVDVQRVIERLMCIYPLEQVDNCGCFSVGDCEENITDPDTRSGDREFIIHGSIRKRTPSGHIFDPVEITIATTKEGKILQERRNDFIRTYNDVPLDIDVLPLVQKAVAKEFGEQTQNSTITIETAALVRKTEKDGVQQEMIQGFAAFHPPLKRKLSWGDEICDGAYFNLSADGDRPLLNFRRNHTSMHISQRAPATGIRTGTPPGVPSSQHIKPIEE